MSKVEAQNSTVEISAKNIPENLVPGKNYTIVFEILNKTGNPLNLNCEFVIPDQFYLATNIKKVDVGANNKKIVLFTFGVNNHCAAGNYKTLLKITNNNNVPIASQEIALRVSKLYNLTVEVLNAPEYLRLEKEFYCEYLVTNNGNSEEKINFEAFNPLKIVPANAMLKPDSSLVVAVYQKVPENVSSKTMVLNNLKAVIVSKDTLFSNRVAVNVYPNNTRKPDLYYRFPITATTIFNSLRGLDTLDVFKFKIEGQGFLDRDNKHYLSFDYSGPSQSDIVRFGDYERYSILYRSKKMEVILGHVNFSLSDITETSRYGTGGILSYDFGKTTTTLFYEKPRFTKGISDSYGGKISQALSDKTHIEAGFINRTLFEDNEEFNSKIFNIASFYTHDKIKINGEVAYESNYKTNGFAFSLASYLNFKKAYLINSAQYSDKNYKGYLRNSKQYFSQANYRFNKKFGLQIGAEYRAINPVKDTINYTSSPITTKYQAYVNYNINRYNKIRVGGYFKKKEDQLSLDYYNFEEKLATFSFFSRMPYKYDLNWQNRVGKTTNFLAEGTEPQSTLYSSLSVTVNILKNLTVGVNGEYEQSNKHSLENEILKTFYYGSNIQYDLKSYLNFSLFYQKDYNFDELDEAQNYLQAKLNYNYQRRHFLSLAVSESSLPVFPITKELLITATYSFVVNVPVSKNKTVGSLTGKITSVEKNNVEGILVFLDDHIAMTDKKGVFNFYNLKPKTYRLYIKQSSLPKNKIIIHQQPIDIDIFPNKETEVFYEMGNAGSLFGQVIFKDSLLIQSSKFIKKLPNLIVKITKEDNTYYTKTDNDGKFWFKELTPGDWTVELIVKNFLDDFVFSETKKTISVESNEESKAVFNASNKNREIKKSKKTFKL
ncbi:MAG: carboxypeptidase-like regulatory domain-containing protein [Lutibacter sp.]|nr:carboxypeptidase-like regulatory domain-containing protein [Lutibacter sp.]